MKLRLQWFVIPAFALSVGACKKENPPAKVDAPPAEQPGVVEKTVEKVKDAVQEIMPAKPAVSPEERGAKLGFAKHLPKDVEALVSVYDAADIGERAKSLKLWKLIEGEMGTAADLGMPEDNVEDAADAVAEAVQEAAAADPAAGPAETTQPTDPIEVAPATEEAADPNAFSPKDLWGSEVTVAFGKTSGEQFSNLLHLYGRFGYFQLRTLTKLMVAEAKNPEEGGMMEASSAFSEEMISDLINDPEGGIGTIEKLEHPPMYYALKVAEPKREMAAQQIAGGLQMVGNFGDFVEPIEVEKAGAKFTGYKVLGAKLAEQMASERESMEEKIDPEVLDRLFAALAKKDIVLLSGIVGEYVVVFVGGSTDQLEIATEAKDSLAANTDGLGFADEYLSKDLAALVYGEKDALKMLVDNASRLGDSAKGIRDGLAGEDGLGDTREIESLLQLVVEREEALRKLSSVNDSGTIAFFEEGLKIESVGGIDQGAVDWKAPAKLGHLGDSPDVVLFANGTVNQAYQTASRDLLESLFETAYAITRKVSDLPGENEDLAQFKEMAKLFDEKFRGDAVGLWEAFSGDFSEGLGHESALVVDLKGTVPAIPGLPQVVVDKGRFPRASVITPVVDRAKVSASWEKMNAGLTSILAKYSEISGKEQAMPKPLSSEKNGMTTWFFSMPLFTDDFLPSVTVGDQWFVASTSKNQAHDLVAEAAKGSEGRDGMLVKMNFVALQTYAKDMLKLAEENADAIFKDDIESFNTNKEKLRKAIEAMDDLDRLTLHSKLEGDELRTSIHFKTR